MTSTELRGVAHAKEPEVLQVQPKGFFSEPQSEYGGSPKVKSSFSVKSSSSMKRVTIGAKSHEHIEEGLVHQDDDIKRLMNASVQLYVAFWV